MKRVLSARTYTRGHRWAFTTLVSAICLAGTFALTSSTALASSGVTTTPPVTPNSNYLALGDSVTFGYAESNAIPAPNYSDPSSFVGYPEILGEKEKLKVVNAACPGETSASFINASAQSNGCENSPGGGAGYRDAYPLHVSYTGSQLNYAVNYLKTHSNVKLVSLMLGANDFFLCQETTADGCTSQSELASTASSLATNVSTILSAIRNQAHYSRQIAIVNYYSLDYASAIDDEESELLNSTVDDAASPYSVEIADGYGTLEAAAAPFGGNTCTAGLLTQLTSGGCGVHPSATGQADLAQALKNAIRLPS